MIVDLDLDVFNMAKQRASDLGLNVHDYVVSIIKSDSAYSNKRAEYSQVPTESMCKAIKDAVLICSSIPDNVLFGQRTRKTRIVYWRHLAFYFMRHYTYLTLEEIGAYVTPFKPYKYTSIMHGVSNVQESLDKRLPGVMSDCEFIEAKLRTYLTVNVAL